MREKIKKSQESFRTIHRSSSPSQIKYREDYTNKQLQNLYSKAQSPIERSWKSSPNFIGRTPLTIPKKYNKFTIRLISGIEGGEVIGGGSLLFKITEEGDEGRTRYITFGGVSLTIGTPATIYGPSTSTTFPTNKSMRLEDFAGTGKITTIGANAPLTTFFGAGIGYSILTFSNGVKVKSPGYGFGLGAGWSHFIGLWYLSSTDEDIAVGTSDQYT